MQIHLKNAKTYVILMLDVVGSVLILSFQSAYYSRIVQPWMKIVKCVSAAVLYAKLKQVLSCNNKYDFLSLPVKLLFKKQFLLYWQTFFVHHKSLVS
jgi:hypothetical protein